MLQAPLVGNNGVSESQQCQTLWCMSRCQVFHLISKRGLENGCRTGNPMPVIVSKDGCLCSISHFRLREDPFPTHPLVQVLPTFTID